MNKVAQKEFYQGIGIGIGNQLGEAIVNGTMTIEEVNKILASIVIPQQQKQQEATDSDWLTEAVKDLKELTRIHHKLRDILCKHMETFDEVYPREFPMHGTSLKSDDKCKVTEYDCPWSSEEYDYSSVSDDEELVEFVDGFVDDVIDLL